MNILITGASGFIGSHISNALIKHGHNVTLCVRNSKLAKQRWPETQVITANFSQDNTVSVWLHRIDKIDVVINAVGIIGESGTQYFKNIHEDAPCALFKACEQAGIQKVIQISALGADETAFSQYHLTKRAADSCLMGLDLNWSILMPSIVFGTGAKSMELFRVIAALPLIPVADKGDQAVQPIHVDDLVQAVLQLIQSSESRKLRIALVGPVSITIKEIVSRLRHWLGLGDARFISIPYSLILIAGYLGGFLGNTLITNESIKMLRRGNTADVAPFVKQFGFMPVSLDEYLKNTASQQADYWHAGLYFLKPLLRFSIAFLWIFTGITSAFFFPVEISYSMLEKAGITGYWQPVMLFGAATTDIILGLATLLAYRINLIGILQIAVIMLYTVIISFSLPELWLHPFGAISKNIPLIIATFMMLVLEKK